MSSLPYTSYRPSRRSNAQRSGAHQSRLHPYTRPHNPPSSSSDDEPVILGVEYEDPLLNSSLDPENLSLVVQRCYTSIQANSRRLHKLQTELAAVAGQVSAILSKLNEEEKRKFTLKDLCEYHSLMSSVTRDTGPHPPARQLSPELPEQPGQANSGRASKPSSVDLPSAPLPSAPLPSAPLPSAPLPSAHLPSVPLPSAPLPSAPLPSAPLPSAPLPSAPLPSALLPSAPLPSAPLPSSSSSVPAVKVSRTTEWRRRKAAVHQAATQPAPSLESTEKSTNDAQPANRSERKVYSCRVCGQPMSSEGHSQFQGYRYCPKTPGQLPLAEWKAKTKEAMRRRKEAQAAQGTSSQS